VRCGMISDAAQDIGHPTAHVSRTGRQPDPYARWRCDHPRSTVMTRRSSTRLTSRPIRIAVPSVSVTSIPPSAVVASARHAGGPARSLGSPDTGSLATRTGRNIGAGSARSVPSRTRRRQFHNKPRLRSYRRATSTKLAPGCSSSATIRSLSSNRQRRRRSDPVIISIPTIVPVLNNALTSAVKINRPIHHRKAVLAGRIRNACWIRVSTEWGLTCRRDRRTGLPSGECRIKPRIALRRFRATVARPSPGIAA